MMIRSRGDEGRFGVGVAEMLVGGDVGLVV